MIHSSMLFLTLASRPTQIVYRHGYAVEVPVELATSGLAIGGPACVDVTIPKQVLDICTIECAYPQVNCNREIGVLRLSCWCQNQLGTKCRCAGLLLFYQDTLTDQTRQHRCRLPRDMVCDPGQSHDRQRKWSDIVSCLWLRRTREQYQMRLCTSEQCRMEGFLRRIYRTCSWWPCQKSWPWIGPAVRRYLLLFLQMIGIYLPSWYPGGLMIIPAVQSQTSIPRFLSSPMSA